jgi:hypothetical protein
MNKTQPGIVGPGIPARRKAGNSLNRDQWSTRNQN